MFPSEFTIVGKISFIETIASGSEIRDLALLQEGFGKGRWRKRKGIATVRSLDGETRLAEVHWYEAHGIGKKELKIKCYLD